MSTTVSPAVTTAGSTATTSAAAPIAGGAMGKDQFLKLLVAQLKNQDPMNPSNGQEMAAQLAQFSSLEQLTQIGQTLGTQNDALAKVAGAVNSQSAQAAVGKAVTATGNYVHVTPGEDDRVSFAVGQTGGSGTLHVFDPSGKEVGKRDLGTLKGGEQSAALGGAADGLPEGWYTYSVDVTDTSGKAVTTQTYINAVIDGMRITPQGPLLTSGALSIPYESVVAVGR